MTVLDAPCDSPVWARAGIRSVSSGTGGACAGARLNLGRASPVQLGCLFGAIVAAYGYSLLTLLQKRRDADAVGLYQSGPGHRTGVGSGFGSARPSRSRPSTTGRSTTSSACRLIATAMAMNMLLPTSCRPCSGCGASTSSRCRCSWPGRGRSFRGACPVASEVRHRLPLPGLAVAVSSVLLRVLDVSTNTTLAGLRACSGSCRWPSRWRRVTDHSSTSSTTVMPSRSALSRRARGSTASWGSCSSAVAFVGGGAGTLDPQGGLADRRDAVPVVHQPGPNGASSSGPARRGASPSPSTSCTPSSAW